MDIDELRTRLLTHLTAVAPDADPGAIEPEVNFRDQFEFDSVDFLNFVLAVEKDLGIRVPEFEYPKLSNLDSSLTFLQELLSQSSG